MGSQNITTFKRKRQRSLDLHKLEKPAAYSLKNLETLNISCEISIFLEIFFWWMFDHVKYHVSSWPHHTLRKDSHLQSLHISSSHGWRFEGKPSDTNVTGCDDGPKPFITSLDIRIHSDRAENSRCSKSLVHGIKVEMPHQTACHRTQTNLLAATSMRYISLPLIEFLGRIIADHFQFHFLTVFLTGFGIHPVKQLRSDSFPTHLAGDHDPLQMAGVRLRACPKTPRHHHVTRGIMKSQLCKSHHFIWGNG